MPDMSAATFSGAGMADLALPRDAFVQSENQQPAVSRAPNTLHISISAIDARGVREFVESRDFLDSVSRAFVLNKGFIATRVRPSLVP